MRRNLGEVGHDEEAGATVIWIASVGHGCCRSAPRPTPNAFSFLCPSPCLQGLARADELGIPVDKLINQHAPGFVYGARLPRAEELRYGTSHENNTDSGVSRRKWLYEQRVRNDGRLRGTVWAHSTAW